MSTNSDWSRSQYSKSEWSKSLSRTITLSSAKSKQSNFQELPEKLLIRIFKNLTETDLIRSIYPVCQNWRYAASHPALWKNLIIKGNKTPPQKICQKLRLFPELQNIYLKGITDAPSVVRQITVCSKKLRTLTLRYCQGLNERSLRNLIFMCPNIERLDLKGTEVKGNRFYQELPKLEKLKSINLSSNKYLSKQNILSLVLNCHHLEEFILSLYKSRGSISEAEWGFIIKSMANTLKSICLDASSIGNYTFHTILQCPLIESIGYCGAYNLSGEVFMKIAEYPMKLTCLKMRFAHLIDGQHIKDVFTAKDMSSLKILDLTGCWKITDVGMEAISFCNNLGKLILKNCKRITSLNPITTNCLELQQLNIAFCTSLEVDESLLSFPKLSELFINEDEKFSDIIDIKNSRNLPIKIRVCISEYNKTFQTLD